MSAPAVEEEEGGRINYTRPVFGSLQRNGGLYVNYTQQKLLIGRAPLSRSAVSLFDPNDSRRAKNGHQDVIPEKWPLKLLDSVFFADLLKRPNGYFRALNFNPFVVPGIFG